MPFLDENGVEVEKGVTLTTTRTVELASGDGPTHTVKMGNLVSASQVLGIGSKTAGADESFVQVDTADDVIVDASVNDDNTVDVTFYEASGDGTYNQNQNEDRDVQIVVEGF
jgi:DNA-directed RNA polymerase alpha subunit